ncbi:MAG: hypothetical protein HKN25_02455 [Pyrinomonadaceae bacterium]|nr:hypothetical protein [Pyrinomonadaceae bacterium]
MWQSKTKLDLIIEVWEKLDCESVGAEEIEAIEIVVAEQFGKSAVDGPMIIARELADEGAELRHAEILELDVKRRMETPYAPMFRNLMKFENLEETLNTIRNAENLRKKFVSENDTEGMRLLNRAVIGGKDRALELANNETVDPANRSENREIAEWFTIWLGSPEVFASWVKLRQASEDFRKRFQTKE